MSERADLHGKSAPPHVISHGGKEYRIAHALDVGDLLALEKALYQRALEDLAPLKAALDRDEYLAEVQKVRALYDAGHFALDGPTGQSLAKPDKTPGELIQARKFATLFLSHLLGC